MQTGIRHILAVMVLSLSVGQVQAQNLLERINQGLERANRVLAGGSAPAATASTGSVVGGSPSEAQLQRIANAMNAPGKPAEVEVMYQEAKGLIGEILLTTSCNFSSPGRMLERHKAPTGHLALWPATQNMQYHNRSQCVDVQRVDAWKVEARNAFSFRVQFVSEQSGESEEAFFTLSKQPDGVWMIQRGDLH